MPENSLGLIMILRDEAANLAQSLAPVAAWFDEVVVVDTGSRDQTRQLCQGLGARVFDLPWQDDFAAARNHSIDMARAQWLFWLDGDNAIAPADVAALRATIAQAPGPAVIWAQEQVVPSGERLWQKRCFPRHPQARFKGRVHEQLMHPRDWPSLAAPVAIRHWGYQDPAKAAAKGRYYLELLQAELAADPGDFYAHWQAARCHANLRQFEQALEHIQAMAASPQARQANPELWAAGHHLWAQVWERLGQPGQARQVLERLLAAMPGHGATHYHLGRLAYAQRDWPGAMLHLRQALDLGLGAPVVDQDSPKMLFMADYFLGRAQEEAGDLAGALESLCRARQRQPQNRGLRQEIARLMQRLGRAGEARDELEQILKIWPQDRQARRLLAQRAD